MSKNKLALFSTPQAKQRSTSKEQVAYLKTNCTILSRPYIGCQARQWNLDSFFEHKNRACPPSISDMGQLRQRSKSNLMECLTKSSQPATIHLGIGAKPWKGLQLCIWSGPELVDIWGVFPGNDSSVYHLSA